MQRHPPPGAPFTPRTDGGSLGLAAVLIQLVTLSGGYQIVFMTHLDTDETFDRLLEYLEAEDMTACDHPAGSASITGMPGYPPAGSGPDQPPSDATNYLGGVGDVLEAKGHRGVLAHLGDLAEIGLYENDRQIHEVTYRWDCSEAISYEVRIWRRTAG